MRREPPGLADVAVEDVALVLRQDDDLEDSQRSRSSRARSRPADTSRRTGRPALRGRSSAGASRLPSPPASTMTRIFFTYQDVLSRLSAPLRCSLRLAVRRLSTFADAVTIELDVSAAGTPPRPVDFMPRFWIPWRRRLAARPGQRGASHHEPGEIAGARATKPVPSPGSDRRRSRCRAALRPAVTMGIVP